MGGREEWGFPPSQLCEASGVQKRAEKREAGAYDGGGGINSFRKTGTIVDVKEDSEFGKFFRLFLRGEEKSQKSAICRLLLPNSPCSIFRRSILTLGCPWLSSGSDPLPKTTTTFFFPPTPLPPPLPFLFPSSWVGRSGSRSNCFPLTSSPLGAKAFVRFLLFPLLSLPHSRNAACRIVGGGGGS